MYRAQEWHVNKVILIGNVGRDPERSTCDDNAISEPVASDERTRKDSPGRSRSAPNGTGFRLRLAEIVGEYVRKGSQIYVEGACKRANGRTRTGRIATRPKSSRTGCRC